MFLFGLGFLSYIQGIRVRVFGFRAGFSGFENIFGFRVGFRVLKNFGFGFDKNIFGYYQGRWRSLLLVGIIMQSSPGSLAPLLQAQISSDDAQTPSGGNTGYKYSEL